MYRQQTNPDGGGGEGLTKWLEQLEYITNKLEKNYFKITGLLCVLNLHDPQDLPGLLRTPSHNLLCYITCICMEHYTSG